MGLLLGVTINDISAHSKKIGKRVRQTTTTTFLVIPLAITVTLLAPQLSACANVPSCGANDGLA